jgi:5-(carboxyamino)imidazole ribonucleotide synthase
VIPRTSRVLSPDATIGILGGGQLGRMLALAAAKLGLKCHIMSPDPASPAFDVVHRTTIADYTDTEALDRFANDVDVVTYEFENIPAETAVFLSARKAVLPNPEVLAITQDRLVEKEFVARLGIGTAPYANVAKLSDLRGALERIGRPSVIKTRRFGYDGKGQITLRGAEPLPDEALTEIWESLGGQPAILEGFVPFECEMSVVAARNADGQIECFDVTENEHANHILKTSRVPARISPAAADEAIAIARKIADAFHYVGVFAVDLFLVKEGGRERVLVNEIAPRVHNSGHWTQDGATVSQFEQHIRAIAGWPLGKPLRHGPVEMTNLLGSEVDDYGRWLATPGASVHLYGKGNVREGRKMGHVNRVLGAKTDK